MSMEFDRKEKVGQEQELELQKQEQYLEEIVKDIQNLIEDAVKNGKVIEAEYIYPEEVFDIDVYDKVMGRNFGNPSFYDYKELNSKEIKEIYGDVPVYDVIEAYEKVYKKCDQEGNCKKYFVRVVSTYRLVDDKYVDRLYFVVSVVPL